MTAKKKPAGKSKSRKPSPGGGNSHKRFDSERIADDIAAFEKSGGRVEKLGVTRVLQKIAGAGEGETAAATPVARKR